MQQKGFFREKEKRHKEEEWEDQRCGMKREQEEGPDK
jgi:hypothetical protein